jgi:heat shock protein HslJ
MKRYLSLPALTIGVLAVVLLVLAACFPPAVTQVPVPAATPEPAVPPPATVAATAIPTTDTTITGIVWQWTSVTNQTTKQTDTVPSPENYTITFNSDGTLTGKADCNNFAGTYSQESGFTIKLGPSTMAFCGEASLDQKYLQLLGSVAAGGPDGQGNLALETAGGEQRMLFKNGGPAPN